MTHEYSPNRAFDSVSISRVSALRDYGLTLRQREFMVIVMVHSGCFLERQSCEFTGTVRGQNSREFMAPLFNYLAASESADEKMVSRVGIEPTTRRLRAPRKMKNSRNC